MTTCFLPRCERPAVAWVFTCADVPELPMCEDHARAHEDCAHALGIEYRARDLDATQPLEAAP